MKKALHITLPAVLALTLSACATAPQQQAAPETGNTQQLGPFLKKLDGMSKEKQEALSSLVPLLVKLGSNQESRNHLESLLDCKKSANRFQRVTYSFENLNALGELKGKFVDEVDKAIKRVINTKSTKLTIIPEKHWKNSVVFHLDNQRGIEGRDLKDLDEEIDKVSRKGKIAEVDEEFQAPLTKSLDCEPLIFADASRIGNIISGYGGAIGSAKKNCAYDFNYTPAANAARGTDAVVGVHLDMISPELKSVTESDGSYAITVEKVPCDLPVGAKIGEAAVMVASAMVSANTRRPLVAQYFSVDFLLAANDGVDPDTHPVPGVIAEKPACPPQGWGDEFYMRLKELSEKYDPRHDEYVEKGEDFCVKG